MRTSNAARIARVCASGHLLSDPPTGRIWMVGFGSSDCLLRFMSSTNTVSWNRTAYNTQIIRDTNNRSVRMDLEASDVSRGKPAVPIKGRCGLESFAPW